MSQPQISPERTSKAQREARADRDGSALSGDDRGPNPRNPNAMPRGKLGDARPDPSHDARTRGGEPPEAVEDRPTVSKVKPEDYPAQDRKDGDVTGATPSRRGE